MSSYNTPCSMICHTLKEVKSCIYNKFVSYFFRRQFIQKRQPEPSNIFCFRRNVGSYEINNHYVVSLLEYSKYQSKYVSGVWAELNELLSSIILYFIPSHPFISHIVKKYTRRTHVSVINYLN
jgi:hypothetical protein